MWLKWREFISGASAGRDPDSDTNKMGLTYVEAMVANPFDEQREATFRFLVDSGAVYTFIAGGELDRLGIRSTQDRTFFLANGAPVKRRMGEARVSFQGLSATCVVLFGEEGDNNLLGVTTLENLGLIFDPMRQRIMPLPMLIADVRKLFGEPRAEGKGAV